jgi:hypothetical protein
VGGQQQRPSLSNSSGEAANKIAYDLVGVRDPNRRLTNTAAGRLFRQISASGLPVNMEFKRITANPRQIGAFPVFAVFGFQSRLSLPWWLKGRQRRPSSRCTQTSKLTTSARHCSLRPKLCANEPCLSPSANEGSKMRCGPPRPVSASGSSRITN